MTIKYDTLRANEALAEIVAEHLARIYRPVTVRVQQPAIEACKGTAGKYQGGALITVAPEGEELDQFKTLLHEIAHLRLDWQNMEEASGDGTELPPGSIKLTPRDIAELGGVDHREEKAAEEIAATWLEFADQNRDITRGEIEGRLLALLEWYGNDTERLIDKIALKVTEMRKREKAAASLGVDHEALKHLARGINYRGLK